MKKNIAFIIFLASCFLLASLCGRSGLPASIKADYNQSLSNYNTVYEKYLQDNQDFQKAKSTYLTYKTLSSQTEALNTSKKLLETRDDLLISYFTLLQDKINQTDGIYPYEKTVKTDLINSRLFFFNDHRQTIQAVLSLDDVVLKSKEIDSLSSDLKTEGQKTFGLIITAKVLDQLIQINSQIINLESLITKIKDNGKDVATLERWLLQIKNKVDITQQKISEAQNLFENLPVKDEIQRKGDFENAKSLTKNANQYLKEAVFNIGETIKEIKTGDY